MFRLESSSSVIFNIIFMFIGFFRGLSFFIIGMLDIIFLVIVFIEIINVYFKGIDVIRLVKN